MRKVFILTFSCLTTFLSAQDTNVVWGDEMKIGKKERHISILGSDSESFYTSKNLKGAVDNFVLEQYSKADLNQIFSKTIDLPEINGETMFFEELYFLGGKFYIFTSVWDVDANGKRAYCSMLSTTGQWLDLPVEVDFMPSKKRTSGEFEFKLSADSSLFLVYHDFPYNRNSVEAFHFKALKIDLDVLWEKRLELPYGEEAFEITDYNLDEFGNIYMLSGPSQKKEKDNRILESLRKKKYVLLSYDWKANKLTEFDVNLGSKWIISVTSGIALNGDICIGGFYSNNQYFTIAGTFFFSLDATTKEVKAKGLMAFSKEFLSEFMSDKRVEKGKELSNFYFDHLILHDDGSALMVAEQFNVTQRQTYDHATGRQIVTNYYNFDDLIAIKINVNGSIKWATRIPKEQSTTVDLSSYSSYSLAELDDKVHFFFNDHGSNLALLMQNPKSELYAFNNIKKSVATHVSLDSQGVTNRRMLFSHKDSETALRPQLYFADSQELYFYSQHRRVYRFGKVKL